MDDKPVKLLDLVRNKIRLRHYSIRTEKAYISWIKRCRSLQVMMILIQKHIFHSNEADILLFF